MKKFILAITIIAASITTMANPISVSLKRNFEIEFNNASNVQWTTTGNMHKVSFIQNNEAKVAFYTIEGDLLGISKNISLDQMPLYVKHYLGKKFPGYIITEAMEWTNDSANDLFISANNEKDKVIFRVSNRSISVFTKW